MSSPLNFELVISELTIPGYSGIIKCALVFANFSTTVSIPCDPLHLVNIKADSSDRLYLSVFTQSSEVGCLEIPYTAFESGSLDQNYRLYENSISPEKERGQLKVTGEVHLTIKKLNDLCVRCESLEKIVRNIKLDMFELEDTVHTHPIYVPKEEKKISGIKKTQNKALRSGKTENQLKLSESLNETKKNTIILTESSSEPKKNQLITSSLESSIDLKKSQFLNSDTIDFKKKSELLESKKSQVMSIGSSLEGSVTLKKNTQLISTSSAPEVSGKTSKGKLLSSVNTMPEKHSTKKFKKSSNSSDSVADANRIDLKQMLEESYKARQDLHLTMTETTDQLAYNLEEQREALNQAIIARSAAMDQTINLTERLSKLEQENESLKLNLQETNKQLSTNKLKNASVDSLEGQVAYLSQELEKSFNENSNLENRLKESIASFTDNNNLLNKRIQDLTRDKSDLQARLEELIKQNHVLKQENDQYNNLVNELCAQISLLQAEIETLKARENREKLLAQLLKQAEDSQAFLRSELDRVSKEFQDQSAELLSENDKILKKKADLESENLKHAQTIENQTKFILNTKKDLEKANSDLAALQQKLFIIEDLNLIIDQLSKQNSELEKDYTKAIEDCGNMKSYIDEQEEQLKLQSQKINELEGILLEKDERITNLETLIDDIKREREVYRPNKDDPIDIALSDYINTRQSALKVQFDREDHGRYNFGTKKIYVKLEQGKLLIRVGGGYMQVEDFVKLYSPIELERFSAAKKEQAQKMRQGYLGKYADTLITTRSLNEASPGLTNKMIKDQMASGSYTPYYAVHLKSPERSANRSPVSPEKLSRNSSAKNIGLVNN